MYAMKTTALG